MVIRVQWFCTVKPNMTKVNSNMAPHKCLRVIENYRTRTELEIFQIMIPLKKYYRNVTEIFMSP